MWSSVLLILVVLVAAGLLGERSPPADDLSLTCALAVAPWYSHRGNNWLLQGPAKDSGLWFGGVIFNVNKPELHTGSSAPCFHRGGRQPQDIDQPRRDRGGSDTPPR